MCDPARERSFPMRWMRERLSKEEGFTLIEFMVVVLIMAVLVAIAIPSFLGFRHQAQDRAAQSDLRNALLAEKAVYTNDSSFTGVEADLKAWEPTVVTAAALSTDAVYVQFAAATSDQVCLSQKSDSGSTFMIYENGTGGTFYAAAGSGTTITCPSAAAPTLPPKQVRVAWSATGFPDAPAGKKVTPTPVTISPL